MLARIYRLKKEADIKRVFNAGRSFKGAYLSFKEIENSLKHPRFAFVVSRKVSKKAVLRNRLRRQIAAIVRLELPKIKKRFDAALLALPGAENESFEGLAETVSGLFSKAKLYD